MIVALAAMLLQVQIGAVVRPDTVTVGQHFVATVRIRMPNGGKLRARAAPDTSVRVDTARGAQIRSVAGAQFTETTVSYVLAAWDTGAQKLGLSAVLVSLPGGDQRISLANLSVYVKSVLPLDTARRRPRPPRAIVVQQLSNWIPWAVAAAAALLLAVAAWLWRRRRSEIAAGPTPFEWAEREFARVDGSALLKQNPERYAIAMAEVTRHYLSLVNPPLRPSLTTRELAKAARGLTTLPVERLVGLLETVDPLKFAGRPMDRETAGRTGAEARLIVTDIHSKLSLAARGEQTGAPLDPARAAA